MIKKVYVTKVKKGLQDEMMDVVAKEEPLGIHVLVEGNGKRTTNAIAVTMRTPGNDVELAVGFMYTEGIIHSEKDLAKPLSFDLGKNKIAIHVAKSAQVFLQKLKRNFYISSSCGVCGKSSIEAIQQICQLNSHTEEVNVHVEVICSLPNQLRQVQKTFVHTGGIHAAAFFDCNGNLLNHREDVGRHNALDKLIGAEFLTPTFDRKKILLLSGRTSFELIQKAALAGIKIVCAIGAPSSLAIETAEAFDMTLIGFLKNHSFNIYCGRERIIFD